MDFAERSFIASSFREKNIILDFHYFHGFAHFCHFQIY